MRYATINTFYHAPFSKSDWPKNSRPCLRKFSAQTWAKPVQPRRKQKRRSSIISKRMERTVIIGTKEENGWYIVHPIIKRSSRSPIAPRTLGRSSAGSWNNTHRLSPERIFRHPVPESNNGLVELWKFVQVPFAVPWKDPPVDLCQGFKQWFFHVIRINSARLNRFNFYI